MVERPVHRDVAGAADEQEGGPDAHQRSRRHRRQRSAARHAARHHQGGVRAAQSRPLSAALPRISRRRSRSSRMLGCDICCGIFNPPQFAIFWTQCAQQGYHPKIMTPPKAAALPLGGRGAGRPRHGHHDRGVVVAASSLQVGPHRPDGAAILRRLYRRDRQAMDPADRVQACLPRNRGRCAEAGEEARRRVDPRCRRRDRLPFAGRSAHLEGRADQSGEERLHHAARRRPVEAGQEVQIRPQRRLQQDGAGHPARQPVRTDQGANSRRMAALLELDGVSKSFGALKAADDLDPRGRGGRGAWP